MCDRRLGRQSGYFFLAISTHFLSMSFDSGMVVVIMISMVYMVLVFGLLFYVKNDWCDLLFKNFTVILNVSDYSILVNKI